MSSRSSKHTTYVGRVVYDRRKRYFNLRDCTRILRNSRGAFSQYNLEEISGFYAEVAIRLAETSEYFVMLAGQASLYELWSTLDIFWRMFYQISSILQEHAYEQWESWTDQFTRYVYVGGE